MGYTKQVFLSAEAELSRRRKEAREKTAARAGEILSKIPELKRIQNEMAETARSVTRAVINSPENAAFEIDKLRDKNLTLQKKRAELLKRAGYPQDYLGEIKACDICGGSGFAGARMCRCFKDILENEARRELSAVSQLSRSSFEDFRLDLYPEQSPDGGVSPRKSMEGILNFLRQYADEFSKDSISLLMAGNTGLGKTHLSLAVAGVVTGRGYGVLYTPVQKLMDKLEAGKFSYSPEAKEQYARDMESVLNCDLLVLDDLGAEFITQFSSSALYNIVNTRLVEARPTIISTNLLKDEIEAKYAPRMLSRLMGGYSALRFTGRDIRFEKKLRHTQ